MSVSKVWRVRTPSETWEYIPSAPKARRYLLDNPEARLEVLEYEYKYQLVTLLNDAYKEGYEDGTRRKT